MKVSIEWNRLMQRFLIEGSLYLGGRHRGLGFGKGERERVREGESGPLLVLLLWLYYFSSTLIVQREGRGGWRSVRAQSCKRCGSLAFWHQVESVCTYTQHTNNEAAAAAAAGDPAPLLCSKFPSSQFQFQVRGWAISYCTTSPIILTAYLDSCLHLQTPRKQQYHCPGK
jgi:hypothetical protein